MPLLPLPETCETLRLSRPLPHVLLVELHRPDAANALNTQMGLELKQIWDSLYVDNDDIRCVVLTGHGERVFCAGGDIRAIVEAIAASWPSGWASVSSKA